MYRPDNLTSKAVVRVFAIVLFLLPAGLWFLWFMIPVDPIRPTPFEKLPLLWSIYPIELLLITLASWMYWWSYPQGFGNSWPISAQFLRMYVATFVGVTTVAVVVWTSQYALRK